MLHHIVQYFEFDRSSGNLFAIYKERRSGRHPDSFALGHVTLDLLGKTVGIETGVELVLVQSNPLRYLPQVCNVELVLVSEKCVVVLPEFSLLIGAERRLRGIEGIRMNFGKREMSVNDLKIITEFLL